GQPDKTCNASVGETVVLPCTATSPGELNPSTSRLYWQIDSLVVHFFRDGQDELNFQDERYRGRTSLFLDQIKHGNFSLKLSNVQLLDAATYTCIYKQTGDNLNETQKSKVKLIVSGNHWSHADFLFQCFSEHSKISSRSPADVPRMAILPLSFHLLVTLGVWHL
ncbi:VTCN1 inhibitor, partial [Ramphastos sulfuratus]|nr:VTCN1 inhibitor [Ramphastos sulfuratus]